MLSSIGRPAAGLALGRQPLVPLPAPRPDRRRRGPLDHDLIHPSLPLWVFPAAYVVFGLLMLGTLWLAPVNWRPAAHDRPG